MKAAHKKTAIGVLISALIAFLVLAADKAFALSGRLANKIRMAAPSAAAAA